MFKIDNWSTSYSVFWGDMSVVDVFTGPNSCTKNPKAYNPNSSKPQLDSLAFKIKHHTKNISIKWLNSDEHWLGWNSFFHIQAAHEDIHFNAKSTSVDTAGICAKLHTGLWQKDAWTSGKNAAWLKFCLNAMQCDYTRRCIGHETLTKTHFYCLTVDFHKKLKQLLLKS